MQNNQNNLSVPATPNKIIPSSEKNKIWLRQNNKKQNKKTNLFVFFLSFPQ